MVALSILYEWVQRVWHPGTSEFAGMITTVLTLPSSLLVFRVARAGFGIRPGDTALTFVALLGLSGLINAGLLYGLGVAWRRMVPAGK